MLLGRTTYGLQCQLSRLQSQRGWSRDAAAAAGDGLAGLQAACLDGVRGVIRLSGTGLIHFLQGIVTNDVARLEAPGAAPMYACILNAQGRYLHDMMLHRTQDDVPTLLADVDAAGMEDLLRLLKRYRLRQKIDIQDVSQQYHVWAAFGGSSSGGAVAAAAAAGGPGGGWAPDPRLPQLGLRGVLPAGEQGGGASASWQQYRQWRIQQGVAEGDTEIPTGEVIPLEFNIDGLNGISFTKGCYVGQELMARTHFKGVVRKRLMPFTLVGGDSSSSSSSSGGDASQQQQQQLEQQQAWSSSSSLAAAAGGEASSGGGGKGGGEAAAAAGVQPGAPVYVAQWAGGSGGARKAVGVVRVADGGVGLAVLRLAAVEAAQAAGQALVVGDGEGAGQVELVPRRPEWWPETWGREAAAELGGAEA